MFTCRIAPSSSLFSACFFMIAGEQYLDLVFVCS